MKNPSDLLVRVDTVDQLFNAPAIDPFSDKPALMVGEAGLVYAIRGKTGFRLRDLRRSRIIIELPADQITPGLEQQVEKAVLRYAGIKRKENQAAIRLSRARSLLRLFIAAGLVVAILSLSWWLGSTLFAGASENWVALGSGFVTVICWATIWGPWDRLIYDWLDLWFENRILHSLMMMELVIEAEPAAEPVPPGERL
jgi:hypothetical protein